jgi:imidazole glycerol-phosphate synthase subunit HisH
VIALVDYGAGNLTSVRKALDAVGARFWTPIDPAELATADGVIVPGVGHFSATAALDRAWRARILEAVDRSVPLLGICVGLQWLFEGSTEAPAIPGLGMVRGCCTRLEEHPAGAHGAADRLKVPHVGWNSLAFPRATRLFAGVPDDAQVYFTHSYAAPIVAATAAVTTYGVPFSAALEDGLVSGVQFHPEKSGDVGLKILRNWVTGIRG